MTTNSKIWSIIKYILVLLSFIIVFLVFSWWGIIGYMAFVLLIAGWILFKKWDSYIAIIDYGAKELLKLRGKKKNVQTIKKQR